MANSCGGFYKVDAKQNIDFLYLLSIFLMFMIFPVAVGGDHGGFPTSAPSATKTMVHQNTMGSYDFFQICCGVVEKDISRCTVLRGEITCCTMYFIETIFPLASEIERGFLRLYKKARIQLNLKNPIRIFYHAATR
jgi:hypothetical protein